MPFVSSDRRIVVQPEGPPCRRARVGSSGWPVV